MLPLRANGQQPLIRSEAGDAHDVLAADLVQHWEERRERMKPFLESPGKALIVGGTREICARLYDAIIALRPDWHSEALDRGLELTPAGGELVVLPTYTAMLELRRIATERGLMRPFWEGDGAP